MQSASPTLTEALDRAPAICFDLFHTLFSFKADRTAGRNTSAILGIPEPEWNRLLWESSDQRLRGRIRDKVEIVRQLVHCHNLAIPEATIEEAAEARAARFAQGLRAIPPERVAILEHLRRRGKKLALISNADAIEIAGWADSPLAACFDTAIFSCDVGVVKPEPAIYHLALERLGVGPNQTLFVGDGGSQELRGARQVGLIPVLSTEMIRHHWPEKIAAHRADADYHIESLSELLPAP